MFRFDHRGPVNAAGALVAAAFAFSASAALAGFGDGRGGGPLEGSCHVVIPSDRPVAGTWRRTIDPGEHVTEASAAAAAINAAGSALRVRVVEPGAAADIVVTDDADLPGSLIGETRGCLGPGIAPAASTITLERELPASVDPNLIMTRQVAVAAGLVGTRPNGCSTLIHDQQHMKEICGPGYVLLQPQDELALRRIWGDWPRR